MSKDFKSCRDLNAWQRSIDIVIECYNIAKKFPSDERYGLASQWQREAVSIPAMV